jgi:hypothetical protein
MGVDFHPLLVLYFLTVPSAPGVAVDAYPGPHGVRLSPIPHSFWSALGFESVSRDHTVGAFGYRYQRRLGRVGPMGSVRIDWSMVRRSLSAVCRTVVAEVNQMSWTLVWEWMSGSVVGVCLWVYPRNSLR